MKNFLRPFFRIFCITLIVLQQINSFAQSKPVKIYSPNQSWISINSTARINKKFGMIVDLHVRRDHFLKDPGFYFARVGAGYWIKENITVALGFGQMWVAPAKPGWNQYGQEHRIYQQIQINSKAGKIMLLNRLRNEQRWQEKIENDQFANRYKFTDRLRYLLSVTIPVFKHPYVPSLVVSNELLIQFGKEIIYNTFDQNRAFIGIKQPISKSWNFDIGYMLVYKQQAIGYQYDKINTLRCFFYYTPDFRKKK